MNPLILQFLTALLHIALMEFHRGKSVELAQDIFQNGLERFSNPPQFVQSYLAFLISVNDEQSVFIYRFSVLIVLLLMTRADARALFSRVINTFAPPDARLLWECWAKYVYQYCDLTAVHNLEKQMAEVYRNGTSSWLQHCHARSP